MKRLVSPLPLLLSLAIAQPRIEAPSPPARFAAGEIEAALRAAGLASNSLSARFLLASSDAVVELVRAQRIAPPGALRPQGFSLRLEPNASATQPRIVYTLGHHDAGLLYGGLEVAECFAPVGSPR